MDPAREELSEELAPGSAHARRLVLMRHARAAQADTSDFDRPLAEVGAGDARNAGLWLAEQGVVAEAALVSAAQRAVATFTALCLGAGWSVTPRLDRGLYHADEQTALDLIRGTDDQARTLVVVGHNPTIATLAHLVDDGEGDPATGVAMAGGFTPASVAVFEYDGSWARLELPGARLVAFRPGPR